MTATYQLRDYQRRGLDFIRAFLARGLRRIMFYLPTGGGKTIAAEAMICGAVAKGLRVLFIANRKQLVEQASKHLARAGIRHGILQGENTRSLDARVLVCSIDTIHVRGIPNDVGLIIIDEAHAVAGSEKYRKLLFRYNRVPVVGLSATPFSAGLGKHYDELRGALFQELVVGATISELIELGNLVDVDVFAPAEPDLTGVKTQRGMGGETDYNETQLAKAVDKPSLVGDIVAHWMRLARGKRTVVFSTNIPHSQHIVEAFKAARIPAEHIDYHFTDDERAAVLDRFARGETTILSNVGLLAEGWDCPATECMILARPTKSLIRFIQMTGRVLRQHDGKTKALLLDHSGTVVRLGFPTDDLPLELDDGNADKSGSRQERKKSEPKPCPKCKFVRPAGVHACPQCGFAPQRQSDVEIQDGELVRLDRKKTAASRFEKAATYCGLLQIARERRRSEKWATHAYREIFGVWPRALPHVDGKPSADLRKWVQHRDIAYAKGREKAQQDALSPVEGRARLAALMAPLDGGKVVIHG